MLPGHASAEPQAFVKNLVARLHHPPKLVGIALVEQQDRVDVAITGVGDVEAQTRQVCENLKSAVEAAGGSLRDICRVDVYVRNMEHFETIHKVRRQYFEPPLPASTMVEVCKMTSPEYLIEINAIAVIA